MNMNLEVWEILRIIWMKIGKGYWGVSKVVKGKVLLDVIFEYGRCIKSI